MQILIATAFLYLFSFNASPPPDSLPTGIRFNTETLVRKGNFGDNWCQTWGADNHIYTMLDDGNGWWGSDKKVEGHPGWQGSMMLQIRGDENFEAEDVKQMSGWPANHVTSPLYAYGTLSVDGTMYVWLWKSETDTWYRRPVANRLLYTKDLGKTFYRWDGQLETTETFNNLDSTTFFFYKEQPKRKIDRDAYAFNWIEFCQNGKDNSEAKDDFIYMYTPEQDDPAKLTVIRVHKNNILDKSKYEYFKEWQGDNPVWTDSMSDRGVNLKYPDAPAGQEWMWASWLPSVVYNKGLDSYIMTSYGIYDPGKKYWAGWCSKCKYPASLGFWYAKNPWGPWKQFHYTEHFYADREQNRTYGFKLSPKWISKDGKKMQLIWSDASDDHSTNYKWNQMEIEILTD
ncbi:hypothetical protein [Persicitalea jodogahamensis]|uniref:DUF4185 domain-containing protein n=1 Tax=Persicitalea jodogahamensis TaxID=402147 RepID=A0A8J3D7I0_9BACT|nr:hypothetical protein [Persicitalea jodogahamensis]GHB72127.1 hypothetical protein GCM10007390_27720 [Persicitalea jodogahamensis]